MATLVSDFHRMQPARLRSFILPREHGAWGILLIPLITGASVGFATGRGIYPLILFIVASLSLFCLRTPTEVALGTVPLRAQTSAERQIVLTAFIIYGALAAFSAGWLLWRERAQGLLVIGGAAAILFAAQAGLKTLGRHTRMAAQLVGAMGLTSTAAGAYYVVTGNLHQTALVLWGANWLFAANQIYFVQVRIHGARAAGWREKLAQGGGFLLSEVVTAMLLVTAWRLALLPPLAALAFGPVLLRGLRWFGQGNEPLVVHRLGLTELAHAMIFGILFILAFVL